MLDRAFGGYQLLVFHINHGVPLRHMGRHDRVGLVQRKKRHRPFALGGHLGYHRVGGVEHGRALGRDVLHDHALEYGQLIHRGDVVQAQVVAAAHVGDHRYVAVVKGQAFAQHATARGFQHGGVHVGVVQHAFGALGAAAVAGVNALAAHVDAVGIGHAHAPALMGQQVRDQAHRGGFAIGAGDGDDGDAPVLPALKQLRNDGLAHRAALAERGAQVHAQARRGVHFHDAAALLFNRAKNAVAHHVHAANMQAHHVGGRHGARGHVGVHVVGHVGGRAAGGQVGVVAQVDALALGGHGVGAKALAGQAGVGNLVKTNLGQRRGVAAAALGVEVDLVDQLRHGVHAVADHLGRVAPGRSHQLVAHHQQAKVVARHVAFHQDAVAKFGSHRIGGAQLGLGGDVHRHALALVAVQGLHHHGQADFQRGLPGVVGVRHGAAHGHRHACGVQQFFSEFLVLRNGFGNGAGGVNFGGLDAALLAAPAKTHHAAGRHAAVGNIARQRSVNHRAGAGPQAHVFVKFAELVQGVGQVKGRVVERCGAQGLRQIKGQAAHIFFAVLHHHLVDAGVKRGLGAAKRHRAAGLRLQPQSCEFEHAGHGHGAFAANGVKGADLGKAGTQPCFKPRQLPHVAFLRAARDDGLDGGVVAPEIGAAQGAKAGYFHGVFGVCSLGRICYALITGPLVNTVFCAGWTRRCEVLRL